MIENQQQFITSFSVHSLNFASCAVWSGLCEHPGLGGKPKWLPIHIECWIPRRNACRTHSWVFLGIVLISKTWVGYNLRFLVFSFFTLCFCSLPSSFGCIVLVHWFRLVSQSFMEAVPGGSSGVDVGRTKFFFVSLKRHQSCQHLSPGFTDAIFFLYTR